MAQFDSGHDPTAEAVRALRKANLFDDQVVGDMLEAGASMMEQAISSAYVAAGHNAPGSPRRTGETLRHIGRSKKVQRDKSGAPYRVITVAGKDRRGQRYGTKAFVLNYGRRKGGKIPADYYWTNAVNNTRDRVSASMAEIAQQKIGGSDNA